MDRTKTRYCHDFSFWRTPSDFKYVTDCKAFYNGVVRSQSAGLGLEERRTAIEALALRNALDEGQTTVRWVHSHAQIADGLTKASWQAFGVIRAFLEK